jgi:hypothetical protein
VADPGDRRRVLLELTPMTHEVTGLIYGPIAGEFEQLARRYSVDDLEVILDFLRRGNAMDQSRQARLAEVGPEIRRRIARSRPRDS